MQERKEHYISLSHITQRINNLLYADKCHLNEEHIEYLSLLKSSIVKFEQQTRESFKTWKHTQWNDEDQLNTMKNNLNEKYANVYSKLDELLVVYQKKLTAFKAQVDQNKQSNVVSVKAKSEESVYSRLDWILQDLVIFKKLVKVQQETQVANLKDNKDLHLVYRLYQSLQINYVASSQIADPLFGGYQVDGEPVLGQGICAGKVIKWIYTCAAEGSPRYPLYVEEKAHWHQDYQNRYYETAEVLINKEPILDVFTKLPSMLEPGAFYLIGIYGNGGHALGVRKRHDQVVEFCDPNTGNAFPTDNTRTQMTLLLGLSPYILFDGYTKASVAKAGVFDKNLNYNYTPNLQILERATTQVVTEKDELNTVKEIERLLKSIYLGANKNPAVANGYFKQLLPLVIETLNYKEPLDTLLKIVERKVLADLEPSIAPLIKDRLKLVKDKKFVEALAEKNEVLKVYKNQQEELSAKLNELRGEAYDLVKGKNDGKLSKEAFTGYMTKVTKRLQGFSGLLKTVTQTRIPSLLSAKPLTNIVQFVGETFSKIKGFFKKTKDEKDKTPTLTQQVEAAIAADKQTDTSQRVVLYTRLRQLAHRIPGLVSRFKTQHEGELAASGLSNFAVLNSKARYQLRAKYLTQLQTSLATLQDQVLTDYSKDEPQATVEFQQQAQALITLDQEALSILDKQNESGYHKVDEQLVRWVFAKTTDENLHAESLRLSAPEAQNGLLADKQQLLTSLTTLIKHCDVIDAAESQALYQLTEELPLDFAKAHQMYSRWNAICLFRTSLVQTHQLIDKLHVHTEKSMNEYRQLMNQAQVKYKALFTDHFQLHDEYPRLVDEQVNDKPILKPEEVTTCAAWYSGLQEQAKACKHSIVTTGLTLKSIFTKLDLGFAREYLTALQGAQSQIVCLAKSLENPFHLFNEVADVGFATFVSNFTKIHQVSEQWLNDLQRNNPRDNMWPLFVRQIELGKYTGIERLLELSNRCQVIAAGGNLLSIKDDPLGLFTGQQKIEINTVARKKLGCYVVPHQFSSQATFIDKLAEIERAFSHWLLQTTNNENSLQYLLLIRLADWQKADDKTEMVKSVFIKQNQHLQLLYKAIVNHPNQNNFAHELQEIEKRFLKADGTRQYADVFHFVSFVNQLFPVYDNHNLSLKPDYQDIVAKAGCQVSIQSKL